MSSQRAGKGLEAGCYLRYATFPFVNNVNGSISCKTFSPLPLLFYLNSALMSDTLFKQYSPNTISNATVTTEKVNSHRFCNSVGTFSDGKEVAVKKFFVTHSTRVVAEFLTEVKFISGRNLVHLLGRCKQGQERLLVYELCQTRGSTNICSTLDTLVLTYVKKKSSLNWKARLKVIIGTARGLAYLHENFHTEISKPPTYFWTTSNSVQKSLTLDWQDSSLMMSDPSLWQSQRNNWLYSPRICSPWSIDKKVDVYSYGVVILEIVWSVYERNKALDSYCGFKFERLYEREEVLRVVHVALLCRKGTSNLRPSMSSVITSDTEILVKSSQPAYLNAGEIHPFSSATSTATSHGSVSFSLF
eukprot:Gb_09396 [translate_table: standard]